MSRTVTQDVSRQVNEAVWDANADAMEDMVYLFTTALDSRTCETCAPLDNTRYRQAQRCTYDTAASQLPVPGVAHRPEDPFWDDQRRNSQRLYTEEPKYKGTPVSQLEGAEWDAARSKGFYKSKVKVNGEMYWRRVMPFSEKVD